ncbi:recombinase family protein [Nocardiopsis sp. HUAS JQ3]|uniref:recombinase family protein n=1 Tax=Nocardiopsis sp. HUAS JQ3 TaxID=3061629 RepID=UPI0023A9D691|nr:recombinase family protein [Nocardiopsis sp. HUAS JQ3]WDZ91177.1 recombinase family protein [Nocardiopsis sp. HUAS JQ3]
MAVKYKLDLDALLKDYPGDPDGDTPMIGYIRVSTEREDMISPELQAEHIDKLAKATGRRIVLWVADLDLSGGDFKKRQIVGLIESIEQKRSAAGAREIGVWKYSRFGRNRALAALYLGRLEKAGGHLFSATEQIDTNTSAGRFNRNVLMDVAEFERERFAEGWADVQAYRRKAGLPNSGRERFGYVRKGRIRVAPGQWRDDPDDPKGERYEPDEDGYAAEYRRMYEDAAGGRSGSSIIRRLNRARIPGPSGAVGRWAHSTLWALLDSGFGCGYIRQHDPECTDHDTDKHGWCKNRKWLDGAHPHLWAHLPDGDAIRDRVWKAYRKRRAQSRKTPPQSVEAKYDLTMLVDCGYCKARMTAHKMNPGSTRYQWRCDGKARGTCEHANSASDELLRARVRELLAREHGRLAVVLAEAGEHELDVAQAAEEVEEPRLDVVKKRMSEVQRSLVSLTKKYASDDIPRAAYITTRDEYTTELATLETELAELEEAEQQAEEEREPVDYAPVMRDLLDEWDTLPAWAANKLLKELVAITVTRVSRTEGSAVIRTAWGIEEVVDIVEPKGVAARKARSKTRV